MLQKQNSISVLRKGVLKICSKFTGEHPCRNVTLIMLLSNFIEITLRGKCSPVNLLYIFRITFSENTYRGLLLTLGRILIAPLSFSYSKNLHILSIRGSCSQALYAIAILKNVIKRRKTRNMESL